MSAVSHTRNPGPERDRGRRRLAMHQVRTAVGCRATGDSRRVCRVDRRSRSRRQSRPGAVPRFADRLAGPQAVMFASGHVEHGTMTNAGLATTFMRPAPRRRSRLACGRGHRRRVRGGGHRTLHSIRNIRRRDTDCAVRAIAVLHAAETASLMVDFIKRTNGPRELGNVNDNA
jgi:hypothetical protein